MKTIKIILAATIITAGVIMLSSCNSTKKITAAKGANTEKMTVPSVDLPHHSELNLSVSPTTYSSAPESIKLTLANTTESLAQFGSEFVVEHFSGKKWAVVPGTERFPVTMILHSLPAGESQTYTFHMRPENVNYKKGLYRISKRVMLDNKSNYGVSTEFEIK